MSVNNVNGLTPNTSVQPKVNVQPKEQTEEILINPQNVSPNDDTFEKQGLTKKQKIGIAAGVAAAIGVVGGIIYAVKKGKIGTVKEVAEKAAQEAPKTAETVAESASQEAKKVTETVADTAKKVVEKGKQETEKVAETVVESTSKDTAKVAEKATDAITETASDTIEKATQEVNKATEKATEKVAETVTDATPKTTVNDVAKTTEKAIPKAVSKTEEKLSGNLQERIKKMDVSIDNYGLYGNERYKELSECSEETISSLSDRCIDSLLASYRPAGSGRGIKAIETDFTPEGLKKLSKNPYGSGMLHTYINSVYNTAQDQKDVFDWMKKTLGDDFIGKMQ